MTTEEKERLLIIIHRLEIIAAKACGCTKKMIWELRKDINEHKINKTT